MAIILPFKAVRPSREKAGQVSSLSYETYSRAEVQHILQTNPSSFLQIINPGAGLTGNYRATNRFRGVRERFREFIDKGVLIRDPNPAFYLYEQSAGHHSYLGLLCATSTVDYRSNIIRRHEDTLARRERIFARYLHEVHFNAEPVLMMYPDNMAVASLLETERGKEPVYDFTTADGQVHKFWPIKGLATIEALQYEFGKIDALYIADGHHRTASSNLFAVQASAINPDHTGREAYNYFMSFLLPESSIRISSYNRMVRDLNGLTEKDFLQQLHRMFYVQPLGPNHWQPTKKHEFSMYLGGLYHRLNLREDCWAFSDPLSKLDAHILYKGLLQPILGIADLRYNERLSYSYGAGSNQRMKELVDQGKFAVGFGMQAVKVQEIKDIADAGQVMPPKSTYIEPKLRSGLTIYEF